MSIPNAASSDIPDRLTKSATALAAFATVSMRLGKLSSDVSTVTTIRQGLPERQFHEGFGCLSKKLQHYPEVRGCNTQPSRMSTLSFG